MIKVTSYINPRTYRVLAKRADVMEDAAEDTSGYIKELEGKIEDLEAEVSSLEDQLETESERASEARADAEYYLDTMYSEEYVDELSGKISELEDDVSFLTEELDAYRLIEDKTGKTPEEIIQMFTDLQAVAAEFKCSECGARE